MSNDVIYCSNCGAKNPWSARQCKKCHEPLNFPHPIQLNGGDLSCLPCSVCGSKVLILGAGGEIKCNHCGTVNTIIQGSGYLTFAPPPDITDDTSSHSRPVACPKCGKINESGSVHCRHCGITLELECPACLTMNPYGTTFCANCGNKFISAADLEHEAKAKKRKVIVRSLLGALCLIGIMVSLYIAIKPFPSLGMNSQNTTTDNPAAEEQIVSTTEVPATIRASIEEKILSLPLSNWMPDSDLIPTRLILWDSGEISNDQYDEYVNYQNMSSTATAVASNIKTWGRINGYRQLFQSDIDSTETCSNLGVNQIAIEIEAFQTSEGAEQSFEKIHNLTPPLEAGFGEKTCYWTYRYDVTGCANTTNTVYGIAFLRYNLVVDLRLISSENDSEAVLQEMGIQLAENIDQKILDAAK